MQSFLIADDSPQKMMLLREFVERSKWPGAILQATTTEDAKHLIDTHPDIGAAFVDYYIPSERGPAIIAYLKDKRPHARIALVSSGDSASNTEEAMTAGAEAFVCTSWQSDTVERELMRILSEWCATV
jgi:DNA-binding NarL/FixJ family response regulator